MKTRLPFCLFIALLALSSIDSLADDADSERTVTVGKFQLTAPEDWTRREPKSKIVEYEFSAPASAGDEVDGRVTLMPAGGSVKENVDRWYSQFTQIDNKDEKKLTMAGQKVHKVSIVGTFMDKPGPFAPGVERDGYRMLGVIIQMKEGNYFVKFVGGKQTVSDQEKNFDEFIASLSQK